jgi:hypothetical protein
VVGFVLDFAALGSGAVSEVVTTDPFPVPPLVHAAVAAPPPRVTTRIAGTRTAALDVKRKLVIEVIRSVLGQFDWVDVMSGTVRVFP